MENPEPKTPSHAFIIVNGADIYPLDKDVVNIGRMEDNDIILQGAHVSRYHVQIRLEDGKHRLVDLNSTSGTSVNQQPVEEKWLAPGDVISLAGVPMIYGRTAEPGKLGNMLTGEPAGQGQAPSLRNRETTDAVDLEAIDRYLEFFDSPDESE